MAPCWASGGQWGTAVALCMGLHGDLVTAMLRGRCAGRCIGAPLPWACPVLGLLAAGPESLLFLPWISEPVTAV